MQNLKLIPAFSLRLVVCVMLATFTLCAQQAGQGEGKFTANGTLSLNEHEATKEMNALPLNTPSEGKPENICSISGLHDRPIETAFKDACRTLLDENSCSKFFGGPGVAITALHDLVQHIQKSSLENRHLGMRMSGRYKLVLNKMSGNTYRLFEKAIVNLNGPFYSDKVFPSQPRVPSIGQFRPNSREARLTILLHELGHMLRGADDNWLLPDDSNDVSRSSENTDLIIKRCRNQINYLSRQDRISPNTN